MKIIVDIKVPLEEDYDDDLPPGYPPMSDPLGSGGFEIELFNGATKRNTETTWKTIPGWSQDVSVVEAGGWLYKTNCFSYWFTNEQHAVNLISNDPGPPLSLLQTEYNPDSSNCWVRMPLDYSDERGDLNRAQLGYSDVCNLRFEVTTSSTSVYDYGEDLRLVSKAKGNMKLLAPANDERGCKVGTFFSVPRTYGLKLSEVGSRFLNHYTDAGGAYVAEWIMPDSLYWKSFDTLDDVNYKVTTELDYTADAVGGNIFRPSSGGKKNIKVYLMPRDWVYYCRLDSAEVVAGQESPMAVTWKYDATYGDPIYYEIHTGGWDDIDGPPPCDEADYFPADPSDGDTLYAWLLDNGWYLTGSSNLTNVAGCLGIGPIYQDIRSWPRWSTGFYAHACAANGDLISYTVIGECDWVEGSDPPVIDHSGHHVITACYHALKHSAVLNKYTHNIGLFWGVPPVDFFPPETNENAYWSDDGQVFQHHGIDNLIGDEGYERAKEHRASQLVQSDGLEQSEADDQADTEIFSGYSSYHCIIEQDSETVSHNFKGPTADGNDVDYINGMRAAIWNRIRYKSEDLGDHSSFWDQFGVPDGTWWASEGFTFDEPVDTDAVPIGMGMSPTKAGGLCAIIRVGDSKTYYVWRKTDEEFETCNLSVSPDEEPADQIFPTLEGWEGAELSAAPGTVTLGLATYNIGGGEQQFSGRNGYIDLALVDYQVSCQDGACVSGPSGGASYTLPIKFYPLIVHQVPAQIEV